VLFYVLLMHIGAIECNGFGERCSMMVWCCDGVGLVTSLRSATKKEIRHHAKPARAYASAPEGRTVHRHDCCISPREGI